MAPQLQQPSDVDSLIARVREAWRPPAQLSLSEWAEEYFVLSTETAAEPGRWKTLPYQRAILDAMVDPRVPRVTLQKSARVGYTLCLSAAMGYWIHHAPSSMLIVQPTEGDAEGFSKETIAPMLRDVPVLAEIAYAELEDGGPKSASNTLTHKAFPGGVLSLAGANSGRGFRRISRRVIMFDEVDTYPPSAGNDGDPIKLGEKRGEYFRDRKIIAGSTPLIAGVSRIEEMYLSGDRRRYFVPCPHCGHMDYLRFNVQRDDEDETTGHLFKWPDGKPEEAHFKCRACTRVIDESHKLTMLERGEWRAERPFKGHASFHIWAAYSLSPNATWGQIATRWVEAGKDPTKLQTVVNTDLGETWKEHGEAEDWEVLHQRAEDYLIGTVPAGVIVLTCGVDVQKDRLIYEVVGWGANRESWSIEAAQIYGNTSLERDDPESPWTELDMLLGRTFSGPGGEHLIALMAVDSGYNTQTVYGWARQHPMSRVIAVKGTSGARALLGVASAVDVTYRGRTWKAGYKMWPVGVDVAKGEFYGWLRLRRKPGRPAPAGYCHFPTYDEDYFQQITAEHQVTVVARRTRRKRLEWQVQPNRENHFLDCRVYARAAAARLGIDRLPSGAQQQTATTAASSPAAPSEPTAPQSPPERARDVEREGFWKPRGPRGPRGGGGWFGRRR